MSAPLVLRALAVALVHFLWQGVLVAALLALALRALRGSSPNARYAASCAALAAMAALPIVTFIAAAHPLVAHARALAPLPFPAPREVAPAAFASLALPFVWALGVAAMLVRLAGGALRVRSLVASAVPLSDPWARRARRLARRLGLRRAVRVLGSDRIGGPAALGWLRPVVLVPAAIVLDMPAPALEAVLAHELLHVRRHDWIVNVLQSAVEALLFYHPCVHWVSRRIRAERELCCDDGVVALLGDPVVYARALVSLEEGRSRHTQRATLGVAATGGSLMERIRRLLLEDSRARRAPQRAGFAHTVIAAAALVACATAPLFACASSHDDGSTTARASSADTASWLPGSVTRWMPSFVAAGKRYGVDPELLAIVTMLESRGNPDAQSPLGAVGLMQIMPQTATLIASERGLDGFSVDKLRDPDVNIDFGAFYLATQLRAFGTPNDPARSIELAAAAYNGGPASVRAYLAEGKPLSEETTHYKDRVVSLWREHAAATVQ